MDDETKDRIAELDRKISDYSAHENTRFDYVKWYIGGITLLLSVLALIFNFNYNTERVAFNEQLSRGLNDLRRYQEENKAYIKEQLGKTEDTKVEMLGTDGIDLSGQDLPLVFRKNKEDEWVVSFSYILKNASDAASGPLSYKIYTSDPLAPFDATRSADEIKYKYEHVYNPEDLHPNSMLGRIVFTSYLNLALRDKELPKNGRYPALLKIYYCKGKVTSASVFLLVNQGTPIPSPASSVPPVGGSPTP